MKMNHKDFFTVSNLLSVLRLFLAVPLWLLFDNYNSSATVHYWIFALCIFAAITDILDGFLARKLNQVTEAGKIIDPLADKIAMAVVVVRLTMSGELPFYYFLLIILRDTLIFIGGIYVTKKIHKVLPSNILGKITVLVIGLVILMILLKVDRSLFVFNLFYYLSIILIFTSFIGYLLRAKEYLARSKSE